MRIAVFATAACLLLSACETPNSPEQQQVALEADGRDLAENQCATCHAVYPNAQSPAPEAPPFNTILSRYRDDVLAEELINGIQVAHPMPDFQFNPQGVDALIAYLRSIQTPGEGAEPS
ncbi:MAG: c-type cytochrome [Alphaproteobacteria bacterium]|nr:c-type cytochrome [Alphaproteobacteria bacterium]